MKEQGLTIPEAAERFGVGTASVSRWQKNPDSAFTRNRPASKIDKDALAKDLTKHPDGFLYERAARFSAGVSGMCSAVKRLGFSHKKKV
ncbi:MAG: IS630 transposase-related protein [Methylovulum sp.]|nr:IS630 transposase-related protein [Methylovulum sp.]